GQFATQDPLAQNHVGFSRQTGSFSRVFLHRLPQCIHYICHEDMRLRPLKVKETPLGYFSDLICQIGEISLTPKGANRHTAPRHITQKFSNCHYSFVRSSKTDRRMWRKLSYLRRFWIKII